MNLYRYRAVSNQGELKAGTLSAPTENEAVAEIQLMGLIPVSVESAQPRDAAKSAFVALLTRKKLTSKDVAEFTRQLAILVDSGLTLERSLEVIRGVSRHEELVSLVSDLQAVIRGGNSLSSALRQYPHLFSNFYISFVSSAEISGNLGKSLDDLSVYLERSKALKEQVVSAMVYPAILVMVTFASLALILIYVLPEFAQLFEDMNSELPASTALVLGFSHAVKAYGLYVLAVIGIVVVYIKRRKADPEWKKKWDQRQLGLVLFGELTRKVEMARLSRSLGTLLGGGVPLLQSMQIARATLENTYLASLLEGVTRSLQDGSGLAKPLIETGEFPDFALQMVQVGEETGALDAMLLRVAEIYDEEVALVIRRLLSVLEPLLIIGLGLVIGGIIMSVLVAILSVNELPL